MISRINPSEMLIFYKIKKITYLFHCIIYLLSHLDVYLALILAAANQREELMEIIQCDWLLLKIRQD